MQKMSDSTSVTSHKPRITKIEDFNPDEDIASRQKIIQGWDQEVLRNSSVMVAGAGALGNEIIKNLIMLGFGTIYVVDFDTVVKSNLNRCILFRISDAESKTTKVEAIAKRAKEIDPYGYIKIIPIVEEIGPQGLNYLSPIFNDNRIDLIFGAFDNVASRIHLTTIAYYHGIPYIDGGMWGPIGNVYIMVPPSTPCYVCSLSEQNWTEIMKRLQCSMKGTLESAEMPSLPTTGSIVAAIQVQEALKLIFSRKNAGENPLGMPSVGRMISFNLITNDWLLYEIPKRPNCPVCSNISKV
jgi:molybdopterin/thiamine biosynthesis adenylyltransferase